MCIYSVHTVCHMLSTEGGWGVRWNLGMRYVDSGLHGSPSHKAQLAWVLQQWISITFRLKPLWASFIAVTIYSLRCLLLYLLGPLCFCLCVCLTAIISLALCPPPPLLPSSSTFWAMRVEEEVTYIGCVSLPLSSALASCISSMCGRHVCAWERERDRECSGRHVWIIQQVPKHDCLQ